MYLAVRPCTPTTSARKGREEQREGQIRFPSDQNSLGHPIYPSPSPFIPRIISRKDSGPGDSSNFYIPRNKPSPPPLLLTVRFRLRYLVTTVYKSGCSLLLSLSFPSFQRSQIGGRDGERDSSTDVFFTRYVPPRWKIFVAFAKLHGYNWEGTASDPTGGKARFLLLLVTTCSPSSLSSCSRCYHCRLFCGFSYYLCISTVISARGSYPPAYNKIPLTRLPSSSSFSSFYCYSCSPFPWIPSLGTQLLQPSVACNAWCILGVCDGLDSGRGKT